jgi:enterochelin esterase family protein
MPKTLLGLLPALLLAIPAAAQVPPGTDLGTLGQAGPATIRPDYARTRAVVSPIIHPDRRVTFRLNAPAATDVRITGHVIGANMHWLSKERSLPMTKGADGFWTITLGPLAPEIYPYN